MGLLEPTKGVIEADGVNINKSQLNLNLWRKSISHVPQEIFLFEGSIAQNIALGKDENNIDFKKLQQVSKIAYINEFIEKLPDGFNTNVGEKGVFLSGGQLQRIGLARHFTIKERF